MGNKIVSKWAVCSALVIITFAIPIQGQVEAGGLAPDFTLPDQDGMMHTLSDYRGQNVLIYFYPKDFTPGCTKQACGIRDSYGQFQASNIVVLGISYDSQESHQGFIEEHTLPFSLLSDATHEVAELYGTKGRYPMAIRRSFLINTNGRIIKILTDVDVTSHAQDVLNHFSSNN